MQALRETLQPFFEFELTSNQTQAVEELDDFLRDRHKKVLILKGYAGTGKTSLVSAIINALNEINLRSVLLAPTGRAAKVFSGYARQPAFTIHKKIYEVSTNDAGYSYFSLAPNQHKNCLFFVDEASMIPVRSSGKTMYDRNLLDDLFLYLNAGKNCKLILIGDTAQLPPVGSITSPALQQNYLLKYAREVNESHLTQVVRQEKNSGILTNATMLRQALQKKQFSWPELSTDFSDVEIIVSSNLHEVLDSHFHQGSQQDTVILTRSNKQANQYNQHIRRGIFLYEEEISAGDMLMCVKNNYHWLPKNSKAGFIANGDSFEIEKIFKKEEKFGYHFADAQIRLLDYPDEESFRVKLLLDSINVNGPQLDFESLKPLYASIWEELDEITDTRKRKRMAYQNPYYNAVQVKFAYALTCHKAQGGQWETVFVDVGYFKSEMIDVSFTRWFYTAITRATKKLYLVNFDPSKV